MMKGVIAAVPTPVDADNRPIRDLFEEHCRWALAHGCDGLNILGSTGEATSFDRATRSEIMGWAAGACPTGRLMVGTGTPSLAETVALTEHADDLGYRVALVLPPFYYKPMSDAGLIAWYTALHEALGDRGIVIYFYNFPQMTGLKIPPAVIAALHEAAPARFGGIKDSSGDLDYARAVLAAAPALAVFPSSETVLSHAAADGFAGCISATLNFTCERAARIWADPRPADDPECVALAAERAAAAGPDLIPGIKHLVSVRTGDPRWRNLVPPFLPLSEAAGADLVARLDAIG